MDLEQENEKLKTELANAKKLNEELTAARDNAEKSKMLTDGQFKELLEKENKEKEKLIAANEKLAAEKTELEKQVKERDDRIVTARKAAAFNSKLNGKLKKSCYMNNVDLDAIEIDADGAINIGSVDAVVKKFSEEFPELIDVPSTTKTNPKSNGNEKTATLSIEQWRALPLNERKKRFGEIKNAD